MSGDYLLYLSVGKLLIWIGQVFVSDTINNRILHKLFSCDLCLGVWTYTILALLFKMTILQDVFPYVPFLSELIAGVFSSFLMHLLSIGYREKFSVVVV